MSYIVVGLALFGVVGCYDIAMRMSLKTRNGMRFAVIVIGMGCVLAMLNEHEAALIVLLIGCGMYRFFDARTEGWRHARVIVGGLHPVATEPNQRAGNDDEPASAPCHAVGGALPVQADRKDHVLRSVA